MPDGGSDTKRLLEQWHAGDVQALHALLSKHHDWIHERVHQRLGNELRARAETGDYVQDVVLEVLQYVPRFLVADGEKLRALLATMVENVLRDRSDWHSAKRRTIARERPLPPDTVLHVDLPRERVETPTTAAHRNEQEAWVRLALELLEPDDRALVVMREMEGLPFREIASRLSISDDSAERRYKRAFQRLSFKVKALRRGDVADATASSSDGRSAEV